MIPSRRRVIASALAGTFGAAMLPLPALASSRRVLASMTDGPFYPPRRWRAQWSDWDADLTLVTDGAQRHVARGEHLGLALVVADERGRLIDGAEVEIWQCDTLQHYRHPNVAREPAERTSRWDPGFQGFGEAKSNARGELGFRTIKPVPYPGRTPHIHVKLRHPSFGEATSQLFVAGDPGNARDFLWRALDPADRTALEMVLQPAPAGSGLRWQARQALVVPA